jgi:hypothetical protein
LAVVVVARSLQLQLAFIYDFIIYEPDPDPNTNARNPNTFLSLSLSLNLNSEPVHVHVHCPLFTITMAHGKMTMPMAQCIMHKAQCAQTGVMHKCAVHVHTQFTQCKMQVHSSGIVLWCYVDCEPACSCSYSGLHVCCLLLRLAFPFLSCKLLMLTAALEAQCLGKPTLEPHYNRHTQGNISGVLQNKKMPEITRPQMSPHRCQSHTVCISKGVCVCGKYTLGVSPAPSSPCNAANWVKCTAFHNV